MVIVRKAESRDMDSIVEFLESRRFSHKDIFRYSDYFVYYDGGYLLGCGMSSFEGEYCIIENIIVDEKYLRNKIGTAIAKTILNFYERAGARFSLSRGKCRGFCESLGFCEAAKEELPSYIQKMVPFDEGIGSIFVVSLEDYFKSCS